ncbi:MAG: hypothetical protein QG635_679 [Bacteroidota bacterium]|nr:hypothetical protein [Bacteroidota bacterium]
MDTLQVTIDVDSRKKYNILEDSIAFDEIKVKIINQLARDAMNRCRETAGKTDLANLTLEDINIEIKNARNEAKSRY